MANEDRNQPLSLNQRHTRFLSSLSASQSQHKHGHVGRTVVGDGTLSKGRLDDSGESRKGNTGFPRFDLSTPSPSFDGNKITEEGTSFSKRDSISPESFGYASGRPVGGLQADHIEVESDTGFEIEENAADTNSSHSGFEFPGEEKQMKVRIEGRRRLCRISKDNVEINREDIVRGKEPQLEDIFDTSSPVHVNKSCDNGTDGIEDMWNELSSRLGAMSIDKNRANKKTEFSGHHQNLVGSAPKDDTIKSGFPQSRVTPYVLSSDSEEDEVGTIKEVQKDRMTLKPIKRIFNEESVDSTVSGNHPNDFILNGPKSAYKLPGRIAKILYPHQLEGLKWLWSLHCKGKGGILGDDMGLGKTMQICSFLAGLFHEKLIRRVLVVAPKTLLTHWLNELSKVGLAQKTREYFATCPKTRHYELQYVLQDKGILVTTYDIVRNNVKSLCGNYHYNNDGDEDEMAWDYMILDEGHLIKNPSTQRAKSLLQIPCLHRIIISGTPIQNNLKELWALFSFCCPDLLGDKKEFKEKYENFINRGNEKNAMDREKRIGSSVAKELRDCIEPYFLRRLKSEVFGDSSTLSKKTEIIVWLRLTQCQRQLYKAFLRSEIVVSACDGSPLAALTILKKICDHPLLLTKRAAEDVLEGMNSFVNQEERNVAERLARHIADVAERFDISENHEISCKISFILSLLGDLIPKGHNVLIFSQTRKMLDLIQETLSCNHYRYMRIDGTTKSSDRAKLVEDFQGGCGAPIFLLTSQVGGLGLTLTKADRVIVVDPAWNPSTDNQSVDRAYRIGQTKDVIVYRLMTCSTVEEKIYRKQVFKGGLFRSATEHKEQIRYFSQQDLRDLFSLPAQGFDVSLTQQQLLEEHDEQHKMEDSLRAHVDFLETLNIAGVSQHSLLFSKAAPSQALGWEEEQEMQRQRNVFVGKATSRSMNEHNVDGARFAFNPKDVNNFHKQSNPKSKDPSEEEIRDKIKRLSQALQSTVTISRLPDKGAKIHEQIAALNLQLNNIGSGKGNREHDIIEL